MKTAICREKKLILGMECFIIIVIYNRLWEEMEKDHGEAKSIET